MKKRYSGNMHTGVTCKNFTAREIDCLTTYIQLFEDNLPELSNIFCSGDGYRSLIKSSGDFRISIELDDDSGLDVNKVFDTMIVNMVMEFENALSTIPVVHILGVSDGKAEGVSKYTMKECKGICNELGVSILSSIACTESSSKTQGFKENLHLGDGNRINLVIECGVNAKTIEIKIYDKTCVGNVKKHRVCDRKSYFSIITSELQRTGLI